jgi:uncharacterized protein YbjQ (UPF0145 family)
MQTEFQASSQLLSQGNQSKMASMSVVAAGDKKLPTIAVGASAIALILGIEELQCVAAVQSIYVGGRIDSFEQATIQRHDETLAVLSDMVKEASNLGESTVVIDCRAYYRNFSYPQLNYPSPFEVLRVVAAIEAQGLTAILEPVKQGRGKCEENSHSTLYELKACL